MHQGVGQHRGEVENRAERCEAEREAETKIYIPESSHREGKYREDIKGKDLK